MRFLIDTNIFLEILLDQEKSEEAKALLSKVEEYKFFTSDFSIHSIGLILFYRKKNIVFQQFIHEMLIDVGIHILSLSVEDLDEVSITSDKFNLDFDDAYQYMIAEKYDLKIVSFDSDFDRTKRGRKEPKDILTK
jgi:hypothetical protein